MGSPLHDRQVAAYVVAAIYVTLVGALMWFGRGQRKDSGASVKRLFGVAVGLALAALLPLVVPLCLGVGVGDLSRAGDDFGWAGPLPVHYWVAVFAAYFAAVVTIKSLMSIGRVFSRSALPVATDPGLVARVAELSHRIGVKPPRVLLFGSNTASLRANAATGGLVGTSLVVSDGVLHRLTADERDSILAHELGHAARRTVWIYVGLLLTAQVAAVLASAFTSPFVAGVLGVALAFGLVKVAGHFEEPAADRLAAGAVGFATTASALHKIHAVERPFVGWLASLIHATQTHPSEESRRASLRAAAPPGERAAIACDEAAARRDRLASRAVFALWVAALGAAFWMGMEPTLELWAAAGLLLVMTAPTLLVIAAHLRDLVHLSRLGYLRVPWGSLLLRLLIAASGIVLAFLISLQRRLSGEPRAESEGPVPMIGMVALVVLLLVAMVPWPSRTRRLMARARVAAGAHEFDKALELYDELPRRAARRPLSRLGRAEVRALCGDREGALADLEALLEDRPLYHPARLFAAVLGGPIDAPRALAQVTRVEERVSGTHNTAALRASLLRRLGRLEEAEEAIEEALKQKPRLGIYHNLAARIAVTRGDLEAAERSLATAEELAPGDAFVALTVAELALARGDAAAAREKYEKACEASRRQPMAHLGMDLAQLEERLPPAAVE